MIITTTMFSTFAECRIKYKHQFLTKQYRPPFNKAAMEFGSTVEQAVNFMVRYPDSPDFIEVFASEWAIRKGLPIVYPKDSPWEVFRDQGVCLLQKLHENKPMFMITSPVDIQLPVERMIPGTTHKAATYSDFVAWNPPTTINLKVGAMSYPDYPGVAGMDYQLLFEAWCLEATKVAFLTLNRKKIEIQYLEAPVLTSHLINFENTLITMANILDSGNYSDIANVRPFIGKCTNCDFLGICLQNEHLIADRLLPDAPKTRAQYLWIMDDDLEKFPGFISTGISCKNITRVSQPMYQDEIAW